MQRMCAPWFQAETSPLFHPRDELVLANLRRVIGIAGRYSLRGLPFPDLIQEGTGALDVRKDGAGIKEGLPRRLPVGSPAQLAVDAGVGAGLGRDGADADGAPEPPGWHRTKRLHLFLLV